MELGNIVFGNSRGEFEVPRTDEWYNALIRLFEAIEPDRDNSWREYGVSFENDTFSAMPYYWGDCTCGYEEKEWKWSDSNKHESHCYQTAIKNAKDEWLVNNPEPDAQMMNIAVEGIEPGVTMLTAEPASSPSADMHRQWYEKEQKAEENIYDKYCKEYGLNRKYGCAVHCTCNYEKRWNKFCEENQHSRDCPIVKPNFEYKPIGFEMQWYKYPLRDSYMNQKITVQQFEKIISDCINSLKETK